MGVATEQHPHSKSMKWERSGEMFERGRGGFGKGELDWDGGRKSNSIRWLSNGSRGGLVSNCIGRHFQLMDRLGLSAFQFALRPNTALTPRQVSPTYIRRRATRSLCSYHTNQKLVSKKGFNVRLFIRAYNSLKIIF